MAIESVVSATVEDRTTTSLEKRTSKDATLQLRQHDAEAVASRQRLKEAQSKYGRGKEISLNRVKDKKQRAKLRALDQRNKDAALKARDAEILLENQSGYLEAEGDLEKTYRVHQQDIKKELPTQTARKGFELKLNDLGPYVAEYTRNGKELLLAGRKGHVATMDWRDGKLGCELHLNETVRDAKWLHNNQSFAVAQKQYVYIYDRQGIEIHKLQKHVDVTHMEFLHYHFLLATVGQAGYLKYTDTSTGQTVTEMPTKQEGGTPTAFRQNPWNAVLHIGNQNGTVGLWSPNSTAPLAKMLVHPGSPVSAIDIDREGRYMVSTSQIQDNRGRGNMAVWDIRMFREVSNYFLPQPGKSVAISDRGLTSIGWGTQISIWKGLFDKALEDQERQSRPYMAWGGEGQRIERVRWCPLEDILGVSHDKGFSSIIVPGAGEANYDALEVNPYENNKQRQEAEVKRLLNKLQPETISLNPDFIGSLDLASAETRRKERDLDQKPDDEVAKLKNRGRGRNSSLRKHLRKKGSKNIIDDRKLQIQEMIKQQNNKGKGRLQEKRDEYGPALARFARKNG
ncbi:hypothetical protein FH972_023283 [Carpinus fangiana]|uniref:BING4 C-terminal domain-containing protein n=1 Tax=Carpinus fangiana TaxID=176857 RepID=A0A5N6KVC9_9ROSI|nr:hypothetical protein FH972_023283 [Carpinus fangiana]